TEKSAWRIFLFDVSTGLNEVPVTKVPLRIVRLGEWLQPRCLFEHIKRIAAEAAPTTAFYTPIDSSSACTFSIWMPLMNSENASLPASPCMCCIHGGSQRGGRMAPESKYGCSEITSCNASLPANR